MTHPIIPPPELVREWQREANHNEAMFPQVATLAAQWGADQELEAIQKEIITQAWFADPGHRLAQLRAARRPKPPSLKEQALKALHSASFQPGTDFRQIDPTRSATIRRALEALPDD